MLKYEDRKLFGNAEYSEIVCKVCNETKTRYYAGKYPNNKDKKWVDNRNREFSGKKCPDCHAKDTAANTKARRAKKNAVTSTLAE